MKYQFEIEVDHGQFYIEDSELGRVADTSKIWGAGKQVVATRGVVGIAVARLMGKTRVTVDVEGSEEKNDWLDMGENELDIKSGILIITRPETTDLAAVPKINVAPGKYTVRVFSKGTEGVVDETAVEGQDEYMITLHRA